MVPWNVFLFTLHRTRVQYYGCEKNWVRIRNLLVMSFSLFVLLYLFWLYVVLELIGKFLGIW